MIASHCADLRSRRGTPPREADRPRRLGILGILGLVGAGCPLDAPLPGETERRAVLDIVVDDVALPRIGAFSAKAAALADETTLLVEAGGGEGPARDSARAAWRDAMAAWQELEVLHLGPAGSPATFTGGLGLRDLIYAWPQTNLCGVDQQIVKNEMEEPGFASARLPNVLGLAAVEYVLFIEGRDNACPGAAAINRDGAWDALTDEEITRRRAVYAAVLAAEIEDHADTLEETWQGGYAAALKGAGTETGASGASFPTAQQALDELYAALFAVELITKDKKLGVPAGIHADCDAEVCPEAVESPFAHASKENIAANLATLRRVFLGLSQEGEDGAGIDDLLVERGAEDLATDMAVNLDGALEAVTTFEGTIDAALVTEPERVRALHDAVKLFTDDFKSSLPSVLGLRVPDEGAGDND